MANSREYFASLTALEVATHLLERSGTWTTQTQSQGIQRKWRKSYNLYYGRHFFKDLSYKDGEIIRTGEKGELAAFSVNHYRSLIKGVLAMTVNQKPSFDARAINSDLDSLQQAKLGNNILESYLREKRLSRYLKSAAEHSQVFGKGFVFVNWDPSLGRPYSVQDVQNEDGSPALDDQGQPVRKIIYEGDVDICTPSAFDVYVDQSIEDWSKVEWANVRLFKNKFTLAAQYPDKKDKIVDLSGKGERDAARYATLQDVQDTDVVPVYYFVHKRTRALPNGRMIIYCENELVLYDGPYPYGERLNLFRIVPGEIFGTTEGYSDAFDLMGPQEVFNTLVSIAFTNQQANGVQKLWMPEGCNVSSSQISKGLAIIRGPIGAEPKPLQLTATAREIIDFLPFLQKQMETISGVNSVARGDPDKSFDSGVALALVQNMAIQYASNFQQSWAELLEDVGTFILCDLLKNFANTTRLVAIAGKRNRGYMSSFTKKDLVNIDRVVVDLGNSIARTTAGRVQIADKLLDKGMVTTPQQYLTVMETGNIDPLVEGQEAQLALVRQENEALMDGKPVQAIPGDKHLMHAQEHLALLANPEVRLNAPITKAVLAHVMEHKNQYQTQDPVFAMISGEPPAPPMGGSPQNAGPLPPPPGDGGGPVLPPPPNTPQPIPHLAPELQPQPVQQNGMPQ